MPSENGWEPSHAPAGLLEWRTIPGTNPKVSLQFMKGWPSTVLTAYAADYHAYIEPLRDADSASFTPTNSVATSNHLNGTAMDLNWNSHPFRVDYAGFDEAKRARMRELLAFYNFDGLQIMFWAQDWNSPKDAMHHQMGYNTWKNPKVLRFIEQRIRPDGFSTYKRGGTPGVPVPPKPVEPADASRAVSILSRATGVTTAKAQEILSQVQFALVKANCTNPRRIAAALAQWVIESGHFVYTEEIADGPESQERWKYKGRTWVQLTWLENYRGFSEWCHGLGLVPTPDYFVVRPHELAEQKWAALGPAYWWAIKYPRINEYADRGDIDNVSKWVNAPAWVDNPNKHANGEKERRDAYNLALTLGDQLLVLTTSAPASGDDMAQVPQDQWDRVYRELTQRLPSRSPLRHLNEGLVDTVAGFVLNVDGSQHVEIVTRLAKYGDPEALALLREVAGASPTKYPDRQHDAQLAQAILAEATAAPVATVVNATPAAAPQVVYLPAPEPVTVELGQTSNSTGQIIGQAYDALEALQLSGALTDTEKAPLAALIAVLQTKTGASA
jgi:putative chitinase